MAKTSKGLVAYAESQLGLPYWYGCFGQKSSLVLYLQKKAQYPSQYSDNDFSKQYGKRVHDCVGLIKGYLWSETTTSTPKYNVNQDRSASGMYGASVEKGSIETMPMEAGVLVYKGNSTKTINHVGIYDGDGHIIEAKGHKWGVIKSSFNAKNWKYWSKCPFIAYDDETAKIENTTKTKSVEDVAREVIAGKWGNGVARRKSLVLAGYDYADVQKAVNKILKG